MKVDHTSPMLMQAGTKGLVNVDGMVVTKDFYHFVKAMKDHDENLELACLNPDMAELGEEPFVILERCKDGKLRKIFGVWELNESVLDRIRLCDTNRIDILAQIERTNEQRERDRIRRYQDKHEETLKLVEAVVRNNKNSYSYKDENTGEKVTIYDDRPSERKGG